VHVVGRDLSKQLEETGKAKALTGFFFFFFFLRPAKDSPSPLAAASSSATAVTGRAIQQNFLEYVSCPSSCWMSPNVELQDEKSPNVEAQKTTS
jgi:hypothetical protein